MAWPDRSFRSGRRHTGPLHGFQSPLGLCLSGVQLGEAGLDQADCALLRLGFSGPLGLNQSLTERAQATWSDRNVDQVLRSCGRSGRAVGVGNSADEA